MRMPVENIALTTKPTIKLGIDAKWYFEGPPSGRMVVKNLVDEMVKDHDGFDLYLFFTNKHKENALSSFPDDVKIVFLPSVPNMLSNLFLAPLAAKKYGLEAMLFQNFTSSWPRGLFKIAYIHDMLFLDYPQYFSKTELAYFNNMKQNAAKADLIITISQSERKRLIDNLVAPKKKIAVVYHGIDQSFRPLSYYTAGQLRTVINKYNLPVKYLLFVGRVNVRKNIINLIKALRWLNDSSIKLIVVGEGSLLNSKLQHDIDTYDLRSRVVFTGHVPEDDLYLLYANATIFCYPSYAEGFGLPPLEAMHCGVPVVVSDRTAMPEVCGDAAVYVNPDDPDDIAQKINQLLDNGQYRSQKAAAGLDHSKSFTWERSAGSILNLITKAYDNCKNYSKN